MNSSNTYQIIDEPRRSKLDRVAINPMVIMIATMLIGSFGWFWFILNAYAIGSPTKKEQVTWILGGIAVLIVAAILLVLLVSSGLVSADTMRALKPYLSIVRLTVELSVGYRLYLYQDLSYPLFKYLKSGR